jgi:hypothetical protein
VSVSERDRARMAKLALSLSAVESSTPASVEQRRALRAWINPKRAAIGLAELEEQDEPPEVGMVRRARERQMLRNRHGAL